MEQMISTPLGAEVIVHDAPEHLGKGVLLHIRMHNIFDPRHAEVYLDQEATEGLYEALKAHSERLRGNQGKETHV